MSDRIMTQVLVISKTHMRSEYCIGGVFTDGRFVRLLKSDGRNQDDEAFYRIGTWYDIEYREAAHVEPPHVEDILVLSAVPIGAIPRADLPLYLGSKFAPVVWQGDASVLFDGLLKRSDSGSAYIDSDAIPSRSVGFWQPTVNLWMQRSDITGRVKYVYVDGDKKYCISYVGLLSPVLQIPAGTLVRVSLARWWRKDDSVEKRCYLQISGWYF